jgi:cell division inhibitor SulA
MFEINSNTINMINKVCNNKAALNANWLQHTKASDDFELSNQYANICQQHKQENKWVLFINPEESSIEKLAKTHGIDVSKILMVNYKNTSSARAKIELVQVKSVLSKGNCAAVILSNNNFEENEIAELESSAKIGQTHCFLVKQRQLH